MQPLQCYCVNKLFDILIFAILSFGIERVNSSWWWAWASFLKIWSEFMNSFLDYCACVHRLFGILIFAILSFDTEKLINSWWWPWASFLEIWSKFMHSFLDYCAHKLCVMNRQTDRQNIVPFIKLGSTKAKKQSVFFNYKALKFAFTNSLVIWCYNIDIKF